MEQARQQVIETIKGHNNVLVTVSADPSVDELSAAIGLTLLLDKMEKRSATIFSGAVPPAITFLEPEKTFESNPDSLRDFIIALDKEKADHLRYKVEGDSVKIFITPYRTTLSQDDLQFSQGDYNVELVIALGVKDQAHLDKAMESHGKIMHDSTVVTATAGKDGGSNLGSLNWHNQTASSLCEMVANLADGLKGDKKTLLDQQVSTALLTGIVSSTDRFSNDHTSANTMTIAAQLMAAGANQQLIAAKLEEAHDITAPAAASGAGQINQPSGNDAGQPSDSGSELTIDRTDNSQAKTIEPPAATEAVQQDAVPVQAPPVETVNPGLPEMSSPADVPQDAGVVEPPQPEAPVPEPQADQPQELKDQLELEKQLAGITGQEEQPVTTAPEAQPASPADAPIENQNSQVSDMAMPGFEPSAMPQAPPATDAAAPAGPPPEIINDHGPVGVPSMGLPPLNSIQNGPNEGEASTVDPFTNPVPTAPAPAEVPAPQQPQMPEMPAPAPVTTPTPIPEPVSQDPPPQPDAVVGGGTPEGAAMLGGESSTPPPQPSGLPQLPPLPPLPSDANISLPPPPPPPPTTQMGPSGSPMPAGAVSGDVFGDGAGAPAESQAPEAPAAPEPGQFRIPGQPA